MRQYEPLGAHKLEFDPLALPHSSDGGLLQVLFYVSVYLLEGVNKQEFLGSLGLSWSGLNKNKRI